MSATLGLNSLKIEFTGKTITVPQNNIARLMYYLSVVMDVIQYKAESRLIDFNNYSQLSEEEKVAIYKLALLLNPKTFIDKGIFLVDPSLVPRGKINDFLKITDERIGIHVNDEIMIGGRSVKVLHIMVCKNEWLNRYYNIPISEITNNIRNRRLIQIRQIEPTLRTEEQMIRTILTQIILLL